MDQLQTSQNKLNRNRFAQIRLPNTTHVFLLNDLVINSSKIVHLCVFILPLILNTILVLQE